jgi:K+-sensing histidine kinase KdpD
VEGYIEHSGAVKQHFFESGRGGLGLVICNAIVEIHDGQMTFFK